MKILVGCEKSGRVRDAFLARGHEAISCDLEESLREGPHYKGDVRDLLDFHREPPGPERAHKRSETRPGIANAFAEQWGEL